MNIPRTATASAATLAVKEQHAELVKHEVDVLWHDYFKPEHLEKYPDLHNSVWETTKLASTNKQTVDLDAAKSLVASGRQDSGDLLGHQGRDLRGRGRRKSGSARRFTSTQQPTPLLISC